MAEDAQTKALPDWLTVGAKVAEYGHGSLDASVAFTYVKSIGKRDVVLTNGSRYNVARLWRSTGTWSPTVYLLPPDDPKVVKAVGAAKRREVERSVVKLLAEWREKGDDGKRAAAIAILASAATPEEGTTNG